MIIRGGNGLWLRDEIAKVMVEAARAWSKTMATNKNAILRAHQVLAFVEDYWRREGHSPTAREIKVGCRLSSLCMVAARVQLLESWGFLNREPGRARTLVPHNLGTAR